LHVKVWEDRRDEGEATALDKGCRGLFLPAMADRIAPPLEE
jgi:hypothetical protein